MFHKLKYRGTNWYKCDLHLHTPASKCFEDKSVRPEEWVQRALDQGLNCVAVTDHNTGEWIDIIKDAARDTELIVFPGVEITCSDAKVHLLVIFDTDKGKVEVEDFLIQAGIERLLFGKEVAFSSKSLNQVVELAEQKGAVVIPAHIDEFNGISEAGYGNREEFLKMNAIQAVQVVHDIFIENSELTQDQISTSLCEYYGKTIGEESWKAWRSTVSQAINFNKTILTFSDNQASERNSKHGLWGIGKRFTWIKMNEVVTLESLRQAFLVPKFRVRNYFICKTEPYKVPTIWIESMKVYSSEVTNSINPLYIEFSPQLTTIIGGRGTGKSSIIRFLRGVFNKTSDLGSLESILKEHTEFYKIKDTKDKKGALKDTTKIEVIIYRNKIKYKIVASNFTRTKSEIRIEEWLTEEKVFKVVELEGFLDFFEFDVFSQKQIYEIAQTPNALRNRIDTSIVDMPSLTEQLINKRLEILEQTSKIRKIQQLTGAKGKLETEIIDNDRQIKSLNESGFQKLYKEHQNFREDEIILNTFEDLLKKKKEQLSIFMESFLKLDFETLLEDFSIEYEDELKALVGNTATEFVKLTSTFSNIKIKLENLIDKFDKDLKESEWNRSLQELNSLFDEQKKKLLAEGIEDLHNIEKLNYIGENKKQELKKIWGLEQQLEAEKREKENLKRQFILLRKELTKKRRDFVNQFMKSDNLKIEVKPYRDKDSYRSAIRSILQRDTGFEEDLDKLIDICFNGNVEKQIDDIHQHFIAVRNGESINQIYGGRFQTLIKGLGESQLDEMEITFPEDEIQVFYKPNSASGFKPLSNASAGQKTSAILTFILSFGNNPILLDQPEDDLDNHLIYELIVKRLRKSKESRQIIIVTHNANIPVNGDAEYVIALNPELKTIEVLHSGAIEQPEIKKEICEVMEGGEDAFQLRSKRYKID